jgi:hypothetical protein
MLQHGEIRVHESFNAILDAALFFSGEFAGRYRAGNAFLEAGFGKFVHSCANKKYTLAWGASTPTLLV